MNEQPLCIVEEKKSLCRICTAQCPIIVGIDTEGRPVSARGDKNNPSSEGFFCNKGKHFPAMHTHPNRFLSSQRRNADGKLEPIASAQAIKEVAEKIQAIIDQYGTRAVAVYTGTLFYQLPLTASVATAWMNALGLRMRFASGTIDQPGKQTAEAAHGRWLAGSHTFEESDTWMLIGSNPLVSISGAIPHANPGRRLKRALARGFELIVIDPRKTETARQAALHIQPKPGTDPAVLAGIIREIFEQDLTDETFLQNNVDGVAELRSAVERFNPHYVGAVADIPAEQITQAATIFASRKADGSVKKGPCTAGTGANMSGWSNINEYLVLCINTLCGRYRQAGDEVLNPGVLTVKRDYKAQAAAPYPIDGYGADMRIRGFSPAVCGLPASIMADEMLLEGEGQIKALITIGGNPMNVFPDQQRTFKALSNLELNVAVEPRKTGTTDVADYVLACKLPLETAGTTLSTENLTVLSPALGYTEQYGQYVDAVVEPPEGSDLLEDWEIFYALAQEMNLSLTVAAGVFPIMGADRPKTKMDMNNKPSSEQVMDMLCKGSNIPLDELRDNRDKVLFSDTTVTVKPKDPGYDARLNLGSHDMLRELEEFGDGKNYLENGFDYTLISRRTANSFNSVGTDIDALQQRYGGNPAFIHPDDMKAEGIAQGDLVSIRSKYGELKAHACAEKTLRRGLVALTHGWGKNPGQTANPKVDGANIGQLISVEEHYARYSGIPLMSGIAITLTPA